MIVKEALHIAVLVLEQRAGDEPVAIPRGIASGVEARQTVCDRTPVFLEIFEERVRCGGGASGEDREHEGHEAARRRFKRSVRKQCLIARQAFEISRAMSARLECKTTRL